MTRQEQRRSDLTLPNTDLSKLKGTYSTENVQETSSKHDPPLLPKPDMGRYKGRGFQPQNVW
jgi:hypothetical protein